MNENFLCDFQTRMTMNRWKSVVTRSSQTAASLLGPQSCQAPLTRGLGSSGGRGQGGQEGQEGARWWRTAGAVTAASAAAALAIKLSEEQRRCVP